LAAQRRANPALGSLALLNSVNSSLVVVAVITVAHFHDATRLERRRISHWHLTMGNCTLYVPPGRLIHPDTGNDCLGVVAVLTVAHLHDSNKTGEQAIVYCTSRFPICLPSVWKRQ